MIYSCTASKQVLRGSDRPQAFELHGRVRIAVVDTVFHSADDSVCLVKLPAGRVRILGMSAISAKMANPESTLQIGISGYQDYTYSMHAERQDALLAPVQVGKIQGGVNLKASGLSGLVVESVGGFNVVATLSEKAAVNDVLNGVIYYVVD